MKETNNILATYLNAQKHITSCDLYELHLQNGHIYYYCDADQNINFDGKLYECNKIMLRRNQIKLNSTVVVDNMTVTIYAGRNDQLDGYQFMKAAHDGLLDRATLYLKRCFFNGGVVQGVIGLFGGIVEVKKCGGLALDLNVKAKTQGMSQEFPQRKYYPQGTYSTMGNTVSESGRDSDYCLIAPFIPLKEVLL